MIAPVDRVLLGVLEKIEARGWAVIAVFATEDSPGPPFAYTVGLTTLGHPELAMYGLPGQVSLQLLNSIGDRIRGDGLSLGHLDRIDGLLGDGLPMAAIAMDSTDDLAMVRRVYGSSNGALQIAWPDKAGAMPWEPGYSVAPGAQPIMRPV